MLKIKEISNINKEKIAIIDTSSISFMQRLYDNNIKIGCILKDYELILIPMWVMIEIKDAPGRAEFVQKLIDSGYPIYSIAEETYSELTEYEEANLYQIVLASASLMARVRSYLRKHVAKNDPLDIEPYSEWINKLYEEWPITGKELSNGRQQKKNAGELSITILAEIVSWYYSETETLTVYSQDSDTYHFCREAEKKLKARFSSRTPVSISYKSNDCILCQLYRSGEISSADVMEYRKDERKLTYSKEQMDCSVLLSTEIIDNNSFIKLIKDRSVHIIF